MRTMLLFIPLTFLMAQTRPPLIENEYVRVVQATDEPAAKPGALHEHKQNRVMIYLDPGDIQIRHADGKVENQHWKAGDVAWSPAGGMHTSQNVSTSTIRIVEIEVRSAGQKMDSQTGSALIDNPQVRVYKSSKAPTGKHFVAVDMKTASTAWDKIPEGSGPFVITELK
jgi:uncharacterized RmlC-like cupin family protein